MTSRLNRKKETGFKIITVTSLIFLCCLKTSLGELTRATLVDSYLGVSVFIALTLFLFYASEKFFKIDLNSFMKKNKAFQVPISSILGMLPGCGGAIIVVSSFNTGNVSFGSVVAALISTMGDAAFLLMAKKPDTAAALLPLCLISGIVCGYLVDNFFEIKNEDPPRKRKQEPVLIGKNRFRDKLFFIVFIPGVILGILRLSFIDLGQFIESTMDQIGLLGAMISLFIWATSKNKIICHQKEKSLVKTAEETSFISIWVILAFLTFEYTVYFTNINLAEFFDTYKIFIPLVGVAIGLIPGCGAQIVVTTLFINGVIPFAALVGNSISNDGDALFPAIAINPKAALNATLISTIPAIVLSYFFFFLS